MYFYFNIFWIVIYPGKGLQETSVNIADIYGTTAKTKKTEINVQSPHLSTVSLSSISQYEYLRDYIKKYHKYTLNPHSKERMVWYVIICLLVFYSAIVIPVQLAFHVVYNKWITNFNRWKKKDGL